MRQNASERAYAVVLAVAVITLAAASIPSPLYDLWREGVGFSVGAQGLVFGIYAITLIPALLAGSVLAGRGYGWSLLVSGLAASVVANVVFLDASTVWLLIVARAVQGISVGLVNSAANVLVVNLHPGADRRRASIATAVAVASGLTAGALGSGLLAEFVAAPTHTIFVVHSVLALLGVAALMNVRSSISGEGNPASARPEFEAIGSPWDPRLFVLCCAAVMSAWAVAAMFLAVGPSYALELLGTDNRAIAGGTTAILFALACIVEGRSARYSDRANMITGLISLAAGALVTALAFPAHSVIVLAVGAVFSGCGLGLVFVSTLATVNHIVPDERQSALLAVFFSLLFLANSLPVAGIGFFADHVGLPTAITTFTTIIVLCVALILFSLFRRTPSKIASHRAIATQESDIS